MTDEEILEYAKLHHPIGTKYNSLRGATNVTVTSYDFTDNPKRYLEGGRGEGVLYDKENNTWAKSLQSKTMTKKEELEKLAYEKYPVGTKLQGSWWNYTPDEYPEAYFLVTETTKFVYNGSHVWVREGSESGPELRDSRGNTFVAYYDNKSWAPIYISKAEKYKAIKETLKSIIEKEDITNIDVQDEGFMISWGDVLNSPLDKTGYKYADNDYYLLGLYTYIPYSFEPGKIKLHREVVNEFETSGANNNYGYSGFVHYNGSSFCWGECGVNLIANTIRDEGLTSDNLNMLLIKFHTYLSVSTHGTTGSYRTLDIKNTSNKKVTYKLSTTTKINGVDYPLEITKTTHNVGIQKIDYTKPYIKVLKEITDKAFTYNGTKIIPKVVQHEMIRQETSVDEAVRIDLKTIKEYIKNKQLNTIYDKINSETPISFQNLLHKLPNKLSRVDECIYL